MKAQLSSHLTSSPPLSPEGKLDSDYSVAEIRDLVVHSFESSQIVSALEYFITAHPVRQSAETLALLERFAPNYPYLEQYMGPALQATTIVDYIISCSTNADSCLNMLNMIPRICDKFEAMEASHSRIGYFHSLKRFVAALTLHNNSRRQSCSMQDILTGHCYSFDVDTMARELKQEDMLDHLKDLPLATLETVAGIRETIAKFEVFGSKGENLLQHIYNYCVHMKRLVDLKAGGAATPDPTALHMQQILETDPCELIGDIVFDPRRKVSLADVDAITSHMNTNLVHTITKNTCPNISICDKAPTSPAERLSDILQLLTDDGYESAAPNAVEGMASVRHSFNAGNRDVLEYVRGHSELVATLLAEMHGMALDEANGADGGGVDLALLRNIMKMDVIDVRTALPEKANRLVAALQFDIFDLAAAKELILRKQWW